MPRRRRPLLERGWSDLIREAQSLDALTASVGDLVMEEGDVIHVALLGATVSVISLLTERGHPGLRVVSRQEGLAAFSYSKTVGKKRKRRYKGEFAVSQWLTSAAFVVVTSGPPSFVRHALEPLFASLYPKVVVPFLAQDELHRVVKAIQRRGQPDTLRISEYSAKRRIKSPRRRFESVRDWTDVEPDTAFEEARERKVWFSSLRFQLLHRAGEERTRWSGSRYKLSKYGAVSCDGGFELVTATVLPMLAQITSDRVQFFSNRERSPQTAQGLHPIEIAYDKPLLTSSTDLKRLLESLRRFPQGTCTVLHANPYLHATVVDDLDFSTADIWVLSERSILIVPQLRASHGALKRLVNHIFENFGEGHIGEATNQ